MALAAGRLRRRVALQRRVLTANTYGEQVETWETLATVWAAVEPVRGREFWAARQTLSEATARILIRHRSDVTTVERVADGAEAWDILSVVDPGSRSEYLELYAKEARP